MERRLSANKTFTAESRPLFFPHVLCLVSNPHWSGQLYQPPRDDSPECCRIRTVFRGVRVNYLTWKRLPSYVSMHNIPSVSLSDASALPTSALPESKAASEIRRHANKLSKTVMLSDLNWGSFSNHARRGVPELAEQEHRLCLEFHNYLDRI